MVLPMKPVFSPGSNIAMKVPDHEFDRTVKFYRDVLGLEQSDSLPGDDDSVVFRFGDKKLWIDKVSGISHAEIWLEIVTDDLEAATRYFDDNDCVRRDGIEPLPQGFSGFWLSNPANIIHLVTGPKQPPPTADRQAAGEAK